ncbi:hypothetical protein [Sinomicrobium sp. M5D2P9]
MKNIDHEISEQLKKLDEIINQQELELLGQFSLGDKEEELKSLCKKLNNKKGIYIFEIKRDNSLGFDEWITEFKNKFRGGKDKRYLHQWTPNIVENRLENIRKKNEEWVPLYVGKAKNLGKRLETHIFSELGRPPFALKLIGRGNLNEELFRIKYFKIDVINYDLIAAYLEKTIRKNISPLSGKL